MNTEWSSEQRDRLHVMREKGAAPIQLGQGLSTKRCDKVREMLAMGISAYRIAQSSWAPSESTIKRHAKDECTCENDHPALQYNGDSWEVVGDE